MRRWMPIAGAAVLLAAASLTLALLPGSAVQGARQATPSSAQPRILPSETTASPSTEVPSEIEVNSATVGKRVQAKAGDICLVCNHPIGTDDVVFLVRGHRVPIHLGELSRDLRAQLEQLLGQLEPRGAFLGAEQNQPALSKIWFVVGVYVLLGLVFAALCAHRALHAGHSPIAWFGLGLVLNAIGYLLLLSRGKRDVLAPVGVPTGLRKVSATYPPQPCAKCGTPNHPSASACIGCSVALEPKVASEVARAGLHTG